MPARPSSPSRLHGEAVRCDTCRLSSASHASPCCRGLCEVVPPQHLPSPLAPKWPWRREAGAEGLQSCVIPSPPFFLHFHVKWEEHPIEFWLGVAWPCFSRPGLGTSDGSPSWWHTQWVFAPGLPQWESGSWGVAVLVPSSASFPREVRAPQYHHWSPRYPSCVPIP